MGASRVQGAPQGGLGVRGGARREGLGGGGSTKQGGSAAEANAGGGAPVRIGRGEVVWELREATAVLARESERAKKRR